MLRVLGKPFRARPKTALLTLALVLLVGGALGFYGYVLCQWHAAQTALQQNRAAEARERLGLCLSVWPHSPAVHLAAARAARLTGHYSEAEEHLNRYKQLLKGATEAYQLENTLLRAQTGEEEEVISYLLTLVDNKHPDTPHILETLARAFLHELRYGRGYDVLTRWIKEEPNNPKPYYLRAWVLERLNHPKEAMDNYQKALKLDPGLVPVRLRVAEMLLEDKKSREAMPYLEGLLKQFPDRPDVLARLGQARFLQGRSKEARRLLEAAAARLPNDAQVLLYLGKLENQEGHPKKAEAWLRRAMKADPADSEPLYTLVTSLKLQGRREEAAAALAKYKELQDVVDRSNKLLKEEAQHHSKDPKPAAEIGLLLLRVGQDRLGAYWLNEALARDPGYRPAHQALAELFEKRGERRLAETHRRWLAKPAGKAAKP